MLLPSSSGLTFGLTHLVAASWRTRRWSCGESPPVAGFRPIRLLSWRVKWSIELEPSRRQLWSMGGRWPERSENAGSRELDLQINCSTVGERNPTNVTSATMQLAPMHPMWGNTWEHLLQASALCTMLNMQCTGWQQRRAAWKRFTDTRTEPGPELRLISSCSQVTIDDCNGVQNVLLFCHLALNSLLESNFEILHVVCSQLWILAFKIFADNSDNCWRSAYQRIACDPSKKYMGLACSVQIVQI